MPPKKVLNCFLSSTPHRGSQYNTLYVPFGRWCIRPFNCSALEQNDW